MEHIYTRLVSLVCFVMTNEYNILQVLEWQDVFGTHWSRARHNKYKVFNCCKIGGFFQNNKIKFWKCIGWRILNLLDFSRDGRTL